MGIRRVLDALDNVLLAVVVAAGGWWAVDRFVVDNEAPPPAVERAASPSSAERLLATLEVRRASDEASGYVRARFGQRWADVDRNGCDTRNDVLGRDLRDVTYRPGTHDCVVETGTLVDPYTGERVDFAKGNDTSTLVQIDHVVPLADAWRKGAAGWTDDERLRFANDPRNLLAVSDAVNRAKGDKDASAWVPPGPVAACAYVGRQVEVKAAYHLWVTPAEHDAIAALLRRCP